MTRPHAPRLEHELGGLDTEPRADLTPSEVDRAERLLAAIVRLDREPEVVRVTGSSRASRPMPATRIGRGPITRAAWATGATVAGGALLLGGAVVGLPIARDLYHQLPGHATSLSTAEIASWTAVPSHPSATSSSIEAIAQQCTRSVGTDATPAAGRISVSDVDRRGSVLTMVVSSAGDGARRWCLVGSGHVVSWELVDDRSTPLPVLAAGTVNVQSTEMNGSGGQAISRAYGQVGPDVTGVVLHTASGRTITTTVGDGLWTAWWPPVDRDTGDLGDLTVTWTTSDGATHSASTDALSALR
ncbi:hypothetical protein DEI92_05935 [Curtobacterium sp. MCBD17_034]|uniref:hypothetical protein n=1 Tax=unclassified Curtobacterium TaxID=257496 RepID=UPI000DA9D30F|nr:MULTISPECIES: hypothetical protein [unclassified Curtobacterium]PZF61137.1 hypothetical protein DEI92_05935 [Curtobacterium sp. MCBD17_034]PZM40486.1 hypothetical protein DEI90_02170 [Curtobacterium sp. MCBD17_031]